MKSAVARIGEYPHLLRPGTFVAGDGSPLRFFDSGAEKPPLLLANGLGGPIAAFDPLGSMLASSFRLVSWDYRGLYGSKHANLTDLRVERHASDAADLIAHLSLERPLFLGWSMGVQVGLELARLSRANLGGLVLLSGTGGSPLATLPFPLSEKLVHLFPLFGKSGALFRAALGDRGPRIYGLRALKRLSLVAKTFDENAFERMRREFVTLEFSTYFSLLEELCRHDAYGILSEIRIPSLVVTGGRDRVTPPEAGRRLAEILAEGRHENLPEATHYAAVEFPREIAALVRRFAAGVGSASG